MKTALVSFALALALSSAALADITPQQLADLKTGETRIEDVVQKFGAPASALSNSDGTKMLIYSSMHGHAKAASYIPVYGLFAGGAVSTTQTVLFTFDDKGLLKSYSDQSSHTDCKSGVMGVNCTH